MRKILFILTFLAATHAVATNHQHPPHLDLEMTSIEYQRHLQKIGSNLIQADQLAITNALNLGTRLSKWIQVVNDKRTPDEAIRLTSSTTRRGIPIDKPNTYSPSIIKTKVEEILLNMPLEMKKILTSTTNLPDALPVDDETFITHARLLDRQYQSAARYKSVDEWRSYYVEAANKDVRGYYYLTTNNIGPEDLKDIATIPVNKIGLIKDALTKICQNSISNLKKCQKNLDRAFKNNSLSHFYNDHISAAKRNWDSFFYIPTGSRRRDVNWDGNVATVPFNTPSIPKFIPYLQLNIEDEFRFGEWSMKLNFGRFPYGPVLIFKPNVVPHVNGLGGNEIVMDSNQPIEEYESQWTIRHEFGHVLGLPDCYHEFYDVNQKAYVNYQLDITDLMCSRAGNMNERIYLELKNAYRR